MRAGYPILLGLLALAFLFNQAEGMEIQSPAFAPGGLIPKRHTCDGPDLSPALRWTGVPEGTRSLALIVDDPDAPMGTWVHWVLYALPATLKGLPEGLPSSETLSNGGAQGRNDFGRLGYGGPCPPPGPAHRYYFKLYALDKEITLHAGVTKARLLKAMEGHVLAQATLVGRYGR